MNNGYAVEITEVSKDLTPRERIMLKDTTNAYKLDEETKSGAVNIEPDWYGILSIHNDKIKDADRKDYFNYVIVDKTGTKYITGSESFWNSFKSIYDEMKNETEDWSIKAYRMPSKNYQGKDFLTCSIN